MRFDIDSSESSQFLSGLLILVSSFIKEIAISVKGEVASSSYIKMTADVIRQFGYAISEKETSLLIVRKVNQLPARMTYVCDPDYSTVCYVWLFSLLVNKQVWVKKPVSSYQPDYGFIDVLKEIGVRFIETKDCIAIDINHKDYITEPKTIDMSNMPDQIITLAFLALFMNMNLSISGCRTLQTKESNRIDGIFENIAILGGKATYLKETLTIITSMNINENSTLKTYNDHRFALTFLVIKQRHTKIQIDNVNCINKSCPNFLDIIH
jgi:3-phosphoshikimate 1-carboxyvinyltransferase